MAELKALPVGRQAAPLEVAQQRVLKVAQIEQGLGLAEHSLDPNFEGAIRKLQIFENCVACFQGDRLTLTVFWPLAERLPSLGFFTFDVKC